MAAWVGTVSRSAPGAACGGDVAVRFGPGFDFTFEAALGRTDADGSGPALLAASPVSRDLTAATAGRGMVTRDLSAESMRAAADLVRANPVA